MTGRVRYEVDDRGAAFVTLDAPESRNALSDELLDDLLDAFERAIDATRDMSLPDALEALRAQLALAFTTEDLAEGVAAFREKREAVWKIR